MADRRLEDLSTDSHRMMHLSFKGSMVQWLRRSMALRAVQGFNLLIVNSALLHFLSSLGIAQASFALHSLLRKLLITNCSLLIAFWRVCFPLRPEGTAYVSPRQRLGEMVRFSLSSP